MLTSILLLALTQTPERPRLVVLDPELRGAAVIEGAAVASAVAASARELDAFDVTTSTDIRTMMNLERQRQLLAVNAETTSIAEALGARHVLAMWVAKLGTEFQAEVRLVDSKTGAVLSQKQTSRQAAIAKVATEATGLTHEVLGVLLKDQLGALMVRVSEEAAEIRIDEVIVGSSPLKEALKVSRGRHRLEVRKDGFIALTRQVTIAQGATAVEDVRLLPSPDYINSYQARNRRGRLLAWVTSGAAVALIASGILVDRLVTEPTYRLQFVPRQRVLNGLSTDDLTGTAADAATSCREDPNQCLTDAGARKSQITTLQIASWSLVGAGVVSGIFATWFWLSSEDPNRYAQVALVPTREGFSFAFSTRF